MKFSQIANCIIQLSLILVFSCKEDNAIKKITVSDNVSSLTSFSFSAKNNDNLYQDIVFSKKQDNSYEANVVREVLLNKVIATFDYPGIVKIEGKAIVSGTTPFAVADEFVIQFDDKYVIFHIKRYYAIPEIEISTENKAEITSTSDYIKCQIRIDGKNMYEDFSTTPKDPAEIRGRGNSTWLYYNKKPYRIKLGTKKGLLGMGDSKSWVLLANYRDPTNFMNALVFDMARYLQMPYTNTNRFADVYLNGEYIGMYQFTEQIQQGKNRVDIDQNAGVLLNLDLDDGPELAPQSGDNFYSDIYELPVSVKYPESQSLEQLESIKTDFSIIEKSIKNSDFKVLSKHLDINSMIDFLIIQELTRNVELVSPRSMYMYKSADNIYHFGPAWDFDGGFAFDWASMTNGHSYFGSQSWLMGDRNPSTHPVSAYNYISDFFVGMFGNEDFLAAYKARWAEVAPGLLKYCNERLDDYVLHCNDAMTRNAKRWPTDKVSKEEIDRMKEWLIKRVSNYSLIVKGY